MSAQPVIECRLDHLVWAVPDLEQGVERLHDAIGTEPTEGGRHVGLGTANYLVGLDADAYLEVVGPDASQPQPGVERPFGIDRLQGRPRLVTFAVRVDDIEASAEALARAGFDPGPSFAMQRALPSGGVLSWRLTRVSEWGGGVVPFLIEWGDNVHPSQSCASHARLDQLRAQHPDRERVREVWSAMGLQHVVSPGPVARLEATITGPRGSTRLTG